jgi:hypothetical protein
MLSVITVLLRAVRGRANIAMLPAEDDAKAN